jgi:GNAT superfamily N-acetyltransferase
MRNCSIQILSAAEADLPAIAALAGVIWRSYYPGIISRVQIEFMLDWMYSLETLKDELHYHSIRFEKLLVADELAGFASYGPTNEPRVFKLHKLYLRPDLHGGGLGSLLLSHCERTAAGLGANQMLLAVNKQNRRAIRTYERNGYAVLNSTVTDIGGGFVMDDYIMSKTLTERGDGARCPTSTGCPTS